MSSEKHANLGLHKWAPTDGVLRVEFNDNFGKLDEKTAEITAQLTDTKLVKMSNRLAPEVDDLGKIQRAIDECFSEGKRKLIFTEALVITSSTALKLKSNIDYIGLNSTLDFSGRSGYASDDLAPLIHGEGTMDAAISVTVDSLKGSNTLTVSSTSGISVGDLIYISSNFEWTGDSTNHKHGEMAIVRKITSATVLEISSCLHEDYKLTGNKSQDDATQVSLNPFIQKVNPIENVTISGFTLKGKGRDDTGLRGDYGMVFRHARNIRVYGNKFDRFDQCALDFINVFGFEAIDNDIFHDVKDKGVTNNYIQYGIKYSNASMYGNIKDNRIWNGRHGVIAGHITDFGGIQRHVNVENNFVSGTWHGGIAVHNSCEFIKIHKNTLVKCEYGINTRVGHVDVIENHIFFCTQGIYLSIKPEKTKLQGNRIINPTQSAIIMSAILSTWNPNDIEILDNICDGGGISITMNNTTFMKRGWKINSNTIKNITISDAISVVGRVKGKFDDNEILNITGSNRRGMKFTEVMFSTIKGNSIEGTTSAPIEIQGISDWNTICDNAMFDHDYATAVYNSGTGTNNKIYDNTNKTTLTGDPIS